MSGAKQKQSSAEQGLDSRIHAEGFGHVWIALTGQNPRDIMPQVVGTVLHEGGTRPPWKWQKGSEEFILMAWPQDQPVRAAVLMRGEAGGKLKPVSAFPLLEGLPNDLTVENVHARAEGMGGDVAVEIFEGKNPMWFFDPLFGRDLSDLTPGVTHTFWLGAAALMARKALLDEISIAQGEQFEAYAVEWLKENPGRSHKDVPPFKIDVSGKTIIMPGRAFGEYQIRGKVDKIEDWQFDKMPVKVLFLSFPFEDRSNLLLPLYASRHVLGNYEPQAGDEIETYAWLQGRIIDLESGSMPKDNGAAE